MNLQKKLKKMKISEDSIEIIWQGEATQDELEKRFVELTSIKKDTEDIKFAPLYYFYNSKTKERIGSVYNHLQNYPGININDWTPIIYEPNLKASAD